jgi:hypothetical protein
VKIRALGFWRGSHISRSKTSTSVRKFPTGTAFPNHKIFDKQAKTATTNGVFRAKILQINIVQKWRFL